MREIKTRIKKLENKPVNNRSYVIFVTHGEYNGEQLYLISAGKENLICRTKESANDLLKRIVKNNEVDCIIKDDWEEIEELLKGKIYHEWN